jgi:hypothetical protein
VALKHTLFTLQEIAALVAAEKAPHVVGGSVAAGADWTKHVVAQPLTPHQSI